jgi:hypothetical protein
MGQKFHETVPLMGYSQQKLTEKKSNVRKFDTKLMKALKKEHEVKVKCITRKLLGNVYTVDTYSIYI